MQRLQCIALGRVDPQTPQPSTEPSRALLTFLPVGPQQYKLSDGLFCRLLQEGSGRLLLLLYLLC